MDSYPDRLREAIDRSPDLAPSPEFIVALRRQLEGQARATASQRIIRARRWVALAASLFVAIAAGVACRVYSPTTNALARAAVGDHVECALNMRLPERGITLEEAARRFGPAYRAIQQVPRAEVATADGVAVVLDRHSCVYEGRRFGHIILSYRGATVSLMVTPADQGAAARAARIDGMNVVTIRVGQQALFIAGDLSMNDLTALSNSIFGPLSRELGGA
jgi:hypothetical protein